jgi:hypothetical protein
LREDWGQVYYLENEKKFVIERKYLGDRSNYGEIGRVPMNTTSYQDKAIPVAGAYRYTV